MPLLLSDFKASRFFSNGHFQTIFPNLFRKIKFIKPHKEEINTPDEDFLELDWYSQKADSLAIILHGLEGNASRTYVLGMARQFYENGMDVLAWNFRSCGEKMNRSLRFYHSGDTEDIHTIIQHVEKNYNYKKIVLIGFSMGGNVILKYLGEQAENVSKNIYCAITFSVPVDIESSSRRMMRKENAIYMKRFIRKLKPKIVAKSKFYPNHLDASEYHKIKNFKDFDDRYTAVIHGFKNAEDYWRNASSLYVLDRICIPTLLVNAKNDSFLDTTCFPYEIAKASEFLYLETPESGGHVGFVNFRKQYWSEQRAWEFYKTIDQK
jgi:predicted alpha/beta-fold hydrolase